MAAPARTSWKGFLKLSLVSVPVKAFTANEASAEVHLNQLHKGCNSRIKYQKVCPEHGELNQEQIVSGYEYAKGEYVVVDPEEVDKLRTKADRAVSIDGFVPADSVDARYYAGKTWYLLPDGVAGERPYALLHRGMLDNEVVAIAQVVIAGREQLVLVRPMGRMLVMTGLHYHKKVKASHEFEEEVAAIEFKPDEVALTNTLIGATKVADFDLEKYNDTYVAKLQQLIQMKVDGREIVAAPDHEEPKILNLMDALKKSVAEAQARAAGVAPADAPAGDDDATLPQQGEQKLAPSAGKKQKRKAQG
jgi:DNA end-binding protein Ku